MIRINKYRRISSCACCSSSSSCSYIIRFDSASWRTSKFSSIWPESGLKRRSPGSKKHMLIWSIDVRIQTRRTPFWSSSVLAEAQLQKTHEQKFEEMERDRGPIGSRANKSFPFYLSMRDLYKKEKSAWFNFSYRFFRCLLYPK